MSARLSLRAISAIALSALVGVFIVIEAINGRLWSSDFRVYWEASGRFLHGQAPYGETFGLESGLYKYAPFTLLLFAPWSVLPYPLASIAWSVVVAAAVVLSVLLTERLVRERLFRGAVAFSPFVFWLAVLVVVVHFHREIHLGNVNALLLVLLLLSARDLLDAVFARSGILLGLVLLVKPHFVVLLPLFAVYRRWRTLGFAVATVVAGVMLVVPFTGWDRAVELHEAWVHAMAVHNASPFYTGAETSKMATDTIYSVLWRLSGGLLPATTTSAIIVLAAIATAVLLLMRALRVRGVHDRDGDLLFVFLLLVALVPSITPTDTEHFLFALPMVFFLLLRILLPGRPRWSVTVAVVVLLAFGGNWQDLWGDWSGVLADHGVLGLANAALLLLCSVLYLRKVPART